MKPLIGWSSIELIPLFVASSASLEMKLMEPGTKCPKGFDDNGEEESTLSLSSMEVELSFFLFPFLHSCERGWIFFGI